MGIILKSSQQTQIERAIRSGLKKINNEIEYEALLVGLTLANELKIRTLIVKSDSQVIVNQFDENFRTKEGRFEVYLKLAKDLAVHFDSIKVEHIPIEENRHVDALENLKSSFGVPSA